MLGALVLTILVILSISYGIFVYFITRKVKVGSVVKNGKYKGETLPEGVFDCAIVGAGPAGATMAHYVAKEGGKVALLEKKTFPRDKYCGDAVCTPAIEILKDMGVMQTLMENNEAKYADAGGFVSPSGLSYIGASEKKLGQAAAAAVKRTNLDMRIAYCARDSGASLIEDCSVVNATLEYGVWTVETDTGESYKARVLVCADGATSKLATKLGYVTEPPKGICSRAFVEGGTHNTNFDGVCFYQRESLPGYSAIFRHPNDELNFAYYLIPCGKEGMCGDVTEEDLPRLHNDAIKNDPFISRALGPDAKIERMKAAPLRLGSQGVQTSYDEHLMIIGDAAGHIDPLTGEGIHNAMMGGKAAAQTLLEMMHEGDYSCQSMKVYEDRWMRDFGYDFALSRQMASALYRFPILLDACAAEMKRKGDVMMAKWAEIMTGMKPKSYFLLPTNAIPMGLAVCREAFEQYILRKPCNYANNN